MKLTRRHGLHLRRHHARDAQIGQAAPHQPARKRDKLGRVLQVLRAGRQPRQKAERIVLQHVHALVVGPQVVDLLAVNRAPEVGADKLHRVQLVLEAGPLAGETFDDPVTGRVADVLQRGQVVFLLMGRGEDGVLLN